MTWLVAGLFGLPLLIAIFVGGSHDESGPAAPQAVPLWKVAVYQCRTSIKGQLHDPASAEFELAENSYSKEEKPGAWVVQIDGRAKNGFGALVKKTWQCDFARAGDKWLVSKVREGR